VHASNASPLTHHCTLSLCSIARNRARLVALGIPEAVAGLNKLLVQPHQQQAKPKAPKPRAPKPPKGEPSQPTRQSARLREPKGSSSSSGRASRHVLPEGVEEGSELALFIIDGDCPRWVAQRSGAAAVPPHDPCWHATSSNWHAYWAGISPLCGAPSIENGLQARTSAVDTGNRHTRKAENPPCPCLASSPMSPIGCHHLQVWQGAAAGPCRPPAALRGTHRTDRGGAGSRGEGWKTPRRTQVMSMFTKQRLGAGRLVRSLVPSSRQAATSGSGKP
jgi:hypothetical protein